MNQARHVAYRLRLADGFLAEAQQDITLSRWRSAIDNAQLTIENSAKAVLAILGPVGRTHYPAGLLRGSIEEKKWDAHLLAQIQRLTELAATISHYDDSLYPFCHSLSYQFLQRYFRLHDLDFRQSAINAVKGFPTDLGTPNYIVVIRMAVMGQSLPEEYRPSDNLFTVLGEGQ